MTNWTLTGLLLLFYLSGHAQATPDTAFNNLIRTENGGWIAGDATYSIALPDNRTLWLFGDSFIGIANPDSSIQPGAHMIRNCAVVQNGQVMTALYNGSFSDPSDFVATQDPETWFWPEHGMVTGDTLFIIFSEFGPNGDTTGWNFEFRQSWLIRFSYPDLAYLSQVLLPYYDINQVMYGDRLVDHEGYTYIYGRREQIGNTPFAHVARVTAGNLTAPWEFWSLDGWTTDASATTHLTNYAVSQQYGVFEHQMKWVMITQELYLGSKIWSLVADSPEGPWLNRTLVYETPRPFPTQFTYNAYPHPQFDENDNLLISYNSNGDFWSIFSNVELYRPRFVRVPYTVIDTSFVTAITSPSDSHNTGLIKAWPNPATDKVQLVCQANFPESPRARLHDLTGRLIFENTTTAIQTGYECTFDLSGLPTGVFVASIEGYSLLLIHN